MPQDTLVGIIEMFLEMTDEEFVCVQMIYERALPHETASRNSMYQESYKYHEA